MINYQIELLSKANTKVATEITNLLAQLEPTAAPMSVKVLKKVINSTTTSVYIATNISNKIVGMITLVSFPKLEGLNKTWIEDLVVDEKYRGKGVANALMEKAFEKAKSLGAKSISLTSRPSRIIANKFYKKLGFKIKKTNYYQLDLK